MSIYIVNGHKIKSNNRPVPHDHQEAFNVGWNCVEVKGEFYWQHYDGTDKWFQAGSPSSTNKDEFKPTTI